MAARRVRDLRRLYVAMTENIPTDQLKAAGEEVYSELRSMTSEERNRTFWDEVSETAKRHLTFGGVVGRLRSFTLDVETVTFGLWGAELHLPEGKVLYVEVPAEDETTAGNVYQFVVSEESVRRALEQAEVETEDDVSTFEDAIKSALERQADGNHERQPEVRTIKGNFAFEGGFVPVILKPAPGIEDAAEKQLTLVDILTWLEIADSFDAGDVMRASKILHLAYSAFDVDQPEEPRRYVRTKGVPRVIDISPAANAVFDPSNPHYLQPQDIFSGEGVSIPLKDAGTLKVALRAPEDADITKFSTDDMLNLRESYWLNLIGSLARRGETSIRGSDLLKQAGFTNPFQRGMADTMTEAANAVFKLTRWGAFIDVTGERIRKTAKGRRLISSSKWQPVIDGDFYLDRYEAEDGAEGEARDFEIILRDKEDPIRSLPFLAYATDTGRFIEYAGFPECFKGMRLTMDHRIMWFYVTRQTQTNGLKHGGTILFSTMFKALRMDGNSKAEKQKRKRMVDTLEKMLRRAAGGRGKYDPIIKSWRYKDEAGRHVGVVIKPLDDDE